jgi:sigma-B regulation protein RsbU (phosphoserine phosphatase)
MLWNSLGMLLIQARTSNGGLPPEPVLKALLRADMPWEVLGVIISFAGLGALTVHFLRSGSSDRSLLWFGFFAAIYGVRLLGQMGTLHWLLGGSERFWGYTRRVFDCLIQVPAILFYEELFGRGWKSSIRWLAWTAGAYVALAVVVGAVLENPYKVPDPAAFFLPSLIILILVSRASGYRPAEIGGSRAFLIGALVLALFVVNQHLVGANLMPWHGNVEPIGFFIFICCLGYVAARRFFSNEQRLMAIEQEMEIAKQIQSSILPRQTPAIEGLEISVRYLPMTAVAGDFYDFLPVDEKRLGVLVADVSGHGVPAALIASMVKMAVKSQASNASDPAQVLSRLNRTLCAELQGQFVTAAYLFLDLEQRVALYAGAGHPPLLVWRRTSKTLEEFQENGFFLGFRSSATYSNLEIKFDSGDRVLLYTDGIVEAENVSRGSFGEARFKEFIATHEDLPAARFADSVLQELSTWSGSKSGKAQGDDLTLMVIDISDSKHHAVRGSA